MDDATTIRGAGSELHDDESGAITVAALAAFVILLMVGFTIWDAGRAARDKIDLQTAADSAAYSQAAVQAKAMNMIAFTNVAKRSAVGMHSTYLSMWAAYVLWWERECRLARRTASAQARANCRRNRRLVENEGARGGDWFRFSNDAYNDLHGSAFDGAVELRAQLQDNDGRQRTAFGNEVMALDDYQRYISEITPWWAWSESLIRGTRNGATVTTSYPIPGRIRRPAANGWIQEALSRGNSRYGFGTNAVQNAIAANVFSFDVQRPSDTRRTNFDLLRQRRLGAGTCVPASFRTNVGSWRNIFSASPPGLGNTNPLQMQGPQTNPAIREFVGNVGLHARRSEIDADEPREVLPLGLFIVANRARPDNSRTGFGGGCFWPMYLFSSQNAAGPFVPPGNNTVRSFAAPYELAADQNSAAHLMARSNIVFSYKYTPERRMGITGGQVRGQGRETTKRNFFAQWGYGVEEPDSVTYATSGYWSMARSEIVFPNLNNPQLNPGAAQFGNDGLWMWRPGWTAKLRPMALPGEWPRLPFDLNAAYHATDRYLLLAEQIGLLTNLDNINNPDPFFRDLQFMEKATRTMDPQVIQGTYK